LETDKHIITAGLDEYFEPDGVAVIEWIERWHGALPSRFRNVKIKVLSETKREISYEDSRD
jgi:tRNA A37 threonylcarbamoyladenosine biosynthesis protein TsaE